MKFLLFILLATTGFTCDYQLLTPELNVWGYPVSVEKILEVKLDSEKFEAVTNDADFQIKANHYQKKARFFQYAYAKFQIIEDQKVSKEIITKKICFMVNCSVSDFVKVLIKNTKKFNKEISCH